LLLPLSVDHPEVKSTPNPHSFCTVPVVHTWIHAVVIRVHVIVDYVDVVRVWHVPVVSFGMNLAGA
jgi:hypothetical protein